MGKTYWFECEKCGYRAKVAGKAEQGFHVAIETILCQDCKELYDAVTHIRIRHGSRPVLQGMLPAATTAEEARRAPSFDWATNRLKFSGEKIADWLKYKPQCPVSPNHRVRAWTEPDRCPRCGVYLGKNALAYRVWE